MKKLFWSNIVMIDDGNKTPLTIAKPMVEHNHNPILEPDAVLARDSLFRQLDLELDINQQKLIPLSEEGLFLCIQCTKA